MPGCSRQLVSDSELPYAGVAVEMDDEPHYVSPGFSSVLRVETKYAYL